MTLAFLNGRGWCLIAMHLRKSFVMYLLMAGQVSFRSSTDTLSAPGAVLPEPVVAFLTSSSVTDVSYVILLFGGGASYS